MSDRANIQWLRNEAGAMDESGLVANPHDLADELRGIADDYEALGNRLSAALSDIETMKEAMMVLSRHIQHSKEAQ